jgi:hypothetical protein
VPLPPVRLGQRTFFLLQPQDEWTRLATEMTALTRKVLEQDVIPQIVAAIPRLPASVIVFD